jgi:acyl carrier protein
MRANDDILKVIFKGIDSVNDLRPKEARIGKQPDAALMGESGGLDSLGMVNLIVAIEQQIEEQFHVTLDLADDEAMSMPDNPFATVESLAVYIAHLLERKGL